MNLKVTRQLPLTQIDQWPARPPFRTWVRNDGIARSSGACATSSAVRMRINLGTCAAWTPFLEPSRYSCSRPLCRKLTITLKPYRVSLRDTSQDGWRRAQWCHLAGRLWGIRRESGSFAVSLGAGQCECVPVLAAEQLPGDGHVATGQGLANGC